MPRVLLDESVPRGLGKVLGRSTIEVIYGPEIGLAGASDADVLRAAADFDVFVTCDQNLVDQNAVDRLGFAILVVCTNNWPTILGNLGEIVRECHALEAGAVREILRGVHVTRYGRTPRLSDPD